MDFKMEQWASEFYPMLHGCVEKDRRMGRALEAAAYDALALVAVNMDRSLRLESEDRGLSEQLSRLASEWLSCFRLVARLRLALSGEPMRERGHGGVHVRRDCARSGDLYSKEALEAARELRTWGERLHTLTARTDDCIVRAVLETLARESERMALETEDLIKDKS